MWKNLPLNVEQSTPKHGITNLFIKSVEESTPIGRIINPFIKNVKQSTLTRRVIDLKRRITNPLVESME